jgi:hypothetical protein
MRQIVKLTRIEREDPGPGDSPFDAVVTDRSGGFVSLWLVEEPEIRSWLEERVTVFAWADLYPDAEAPDDVRIIERAPDQIW